MSEPSRRVQRTMPTKKSARVSKHEVEVLPQLPSSSRRAKLKRGGHGILSDDERIKLDRDLEAIARRRREAEADSAHLRFSS